MLVENHKILTPTEYIKMVTNKCYYIGGDDDIEAIHLILNDNGLDNLWDYPIEEFNYTMENDIPVVAVKCKVVTDGIEKYDYRLFEVNL